MFFSKIRYREIRIQVRCILMGKWDPIGVADEPMATDEYDHFIGSIYELLKEKASNDQLINYLAYVETERMGLCDLQGNPCMPDEYRIKTAEALQSIVLSN